MALSKLEVGFFARALAHGALPTGGDMLELGESTVVRWAQSLELLDLVRPHLLRGAEVGLDLVMGRGADSEAVVATCTDVGPGMPRLPRSARLARSNQLEG